MRVIFTLAAIALVMFCLGVGELRRCIRTLFGPATMTLADASEAGLGGYGYVRITELHPVLRRAAVITRGKQPQADQLTNWESAYIPLEPDTEPRGRCTVLAWDPTVRFAEDVMRHADDTEIVGFVHSRFDRLDPRHQELVKDLAGQRKENCWVVRVQQPSWLKALGLTAGGVLIPGVWLLVRLRTPLNAT